MTEVSYTVAELARFTWTNPQATVTISGDQYTSPSPSWGTAYV
jgi:hypothetical protein